MPKGIGASALPGHEVIRQFLEAGSAPVGPTDILRALGLPARLKAALRATLHDMALAGDLACLPPGRLKGVTGLPETVRATLTRLRSDGQAYASQPDHPGTSILLTATLPDGTLLLPGDEVIARLRPRLSLRGRREGRPLRLISAAPRCFPATVQAASTQPGKEAQTHTHPPRTSDGGSLAALQTAQQESAIAPSLDTSGRSQQTIRLVPCDRRFDLVLHTVSEPLAPDTVVLAEMRPQQAGKPPEAHIRSVLGPVDAPGMAARLAVLTHPMPTAFSPEAETEAHLLASRPVDAEAAASTFTGTGTGTGTGTTSSTPDIPRKLPAHPSGRRDLRSIPLVTIDEETAQDFDDAIWAERTDDGFHILIAIADVAHYVRPGSALDQEARNRGNSVYLPGQVVPMLPLALSAGLCSLKPGEDRLCVYIDLQITPQGQRISGTLGRGLMRSAARLTYQAVQAALEPSPQPASSSSSPLPAGSDASSSLPPDLLPTLMAAAQALRQTQSPQAADVTPEEEFVVTLDAQDLPTAFTPRQRLPAHELVASFMIAANGFAAEELDRRMAPGLFRVHPAPSHTMGLCRQMARYAPRPAWHDGLRLACYTHFTSPIRRYADLVNHRALLATLEPFNTTPQTGSESDTLSTRAAHALAGHLHLAERRASSATQACYNRLAALFLRPFIGQILHARVTGTTRTGATVTLTKTGTPSFLFSSALPDELRMNDDSPTPCTSLPSEAALQVGAVVPVVLISTNPAQGTLDLALARNAR
ncbi:RNB domain-containing ribonuclease [Acetobacter tropicalis]|uniref:RNB domain-containing ribonuclease n=1 Tax=Acetobacter tropicalis TaxID=104102 RepID=UPI0016572760|nr:ribonuclease R family protein [Acetobacter tropicalis]MBC9009320.1 VacB/RNase II family 3'-5' exoribonuclease [Acetobacter tropicalis]